MTGSAIETRYAGCRFRSRLEARWAVFFDTLGIRWEYEPQGYALPSGPYLPDFKLFGLGGDAAGQPLWFEVKPAADDSTGRNAGDDPRWDELSDTTGLPVIVAFGMPRPDADLVWGNGGRDSWMELFLGKAGWDNGRAFCTCAVCGKLGIAFDGRSGRVCRHEGYDGDRPSSAEDDRILAAYEAARSARFEHGESGIRRAGPSDVPSEIIHSEIVRRNMVSAWDGSSDEVWLREVESRISDHPWLKTFIKNTPAYESALDAIRIAADYQIAVHGGGEEAVEALTAAFYRGEPS